MDTLQSRNLLRFLVRWMYERSIIGVHHRITRRHSNYLPPRHMSSEGGPSTKLVSGQDSGTRDTDRSGEYLS